LIVYHFCFNLSRTFLFLFLDSPLPAKTALIVYHISFSLSRSFFFSSKLSFIKFCCGVQQLC
ncbi:hypothetical protein, partial [Sedimentibacter saalensis]|uniref:hypothetical protein n=1 Tax=Sedimentibacter saalensis TaxID=130788 RepID=UPI0028A0DF1F